MDLFTLNKIKQCLVLVCLLLAACGGGSEYQSSLDTEIDPPVAAIVNTQGSLGDPVTLDGRNSNDPGGNLLSYSWSFKTKPPSSNIEIIDADKPVASFIPDIPGVYIIQLIVSNGSTESEATTLEIIISPNRRPVADAGVDSNVGVGNVYALNGTNSSDPDGDTLSYKWRFLSRPNNVTAVFNNANYSRPQFFVTAAGEYIIELVVNDGEFDSLPDTVTIISVADNTPPVANAGNDFSVNTGSLVNLNGANSTDAENNPLTYNWQIMSKPAGSNTSLGGATTESPTFVPDVDGMYVIQVIVNDGIENSASDSVNILSTTPAGGNAPPQANAGVDQNIPVSSNVQLNGINSSDADQDALTYQWSISSRPAGSIAALNNATNMISNLTPDVAGRYVVQLVVNDGQISSNPDFTSITALAANTAPVARAGNDQTVSTGNQVNLNGNNSTDADGDALSYSWIIVLKPAGSNASLNNPSAINPNFIPDTAGNYVVQLIVNDGQSNSNPDNVVINAVSLNTPPVANAGNDITVPSGSTAFLDGRASSDADFDSISYQWSFASLPAGSTAVLSSATSPQVSFVPDLFGDYVVQLIVNDGRNNSLPDRITVSATVTCSSQKTTFLQETWPVLRDNCMDCHRTGGVTSPFNLSNESVTGFNTLNFQMFKIISAKKDINGTSIILSRATNENGDHGGSQRFTSQDQRYNILSDMVERLSSCTGEISTQSGLIKLSPNELLRKITLALASRLPTTIEENSVTSANAPEEIDTALNSVMNNLMSESNFYERLIEIFNDLLLTNGFTGTRALKKFDLNNYNNRKYFDESILSGQGYNAADSDLLRSYANIGLNRAPLKLIEHVVRLDRPFTEILTANYVLVNPYSARLMDLSFNDGFEFRYGESISNHDPNVFRESIVTDKDSRRHPHAGVLTTLGFLTKYPSSNSNKNRARARYIFKYFLDTDVEGLSDRSGLDLKNQIGDYPTFQDPQCKQCHDVIDPIAGTFKNWSDSGTFRGNYSNWYDKRNPQQMLAPGYTDSSADLLPGSESGSALQWLAGRIVTDNRFALSITKTLFKGLTGNNATIADAVFIEELKVIFINSNYNLKSLIKNIILSDTFQAANLAASEDPALFENIGTGRLLEPRTLQRKIFAILNQYNWQSPSNNNLLDAETYRLIYGGINSKDINDRITDPTSIMRAIQERIAYQASCETVPKDFNTSISNRILFPFVEITDTPATSNGENKIKQNIQHLHKHILGENINISDAEITRSYSLFSSVWNQTSGNNIPIDCRGTLGSSNPISIDENFTVRSWMAIVSYMLFDYKFLYE